MDNVDQSDPPSELPDGLDIPTYVSDLLDKLANRKRFNEYTITYPAGI